MGAIRSSQMRRALKMVATGATMIQAARKTGLQRQSIYKARAKDQADSENNLVKIQQHNKNSLDLDQESVK